MTPSQDLGLTILKMVRGKMTVDALTKALERADERYLQAETDTQAWAGNNPAEALGVIQNLLQGIRTSALLVEAPEDDRVQLVKDAVVVVGELADSFEGRNGR